MTFFKDNLQQELITTAVRLVMSSQLTSNKST